MYIYIYIKGGSSQVIPTLPHQTAQIGESWSTFDHEQFDQQVWFRWLVALFDRSVNTKVEPVNRYTLKD